MTSGRRVAEASLKPVLMSTGWRPRSAGWFTKDVVPEVTAVLAVGAASKHHPPGHASVTMHVGLRDEAIEAIVEKVTGTRQVSYQGRTWTTPLGYLIPESAFLEGEREFNEDNATAQAAEIGGIIAEYAEPRLRQIAMDPAEMTRLADQSVSSMGPAGLCRIASLRARSEGLQAAVQYVTERLAALGSRTDPAADLERDAAPGLLASLTP